MTTADIPSSRAAIADSNGQITTVWFTFLQSLWRRTGGRADAVESVGELEQANFTAGDIAQLKRRIENLERVVADLDGDGAMVARLKARTNELQTQLITGL